MTRSPHRLKDQVKDTVSELPIHAARLAVMGVGRALLLTDRVRKDYREARESGLSPVLERLKNDAENLTGMVVGMVSGNGTTEEAPKSGTAARDSEISVGKPKPAAAKRTAAERTTAKPAAAKPAASKPAASKSSTASKPAPKPAAKPKPAAQEKVDAQAKPAAKPETVEAKPDQAKPAETETKPAEVKTAEARPATQPKAAPTKELAVSGYDEATLASVRARLRGLDTRQVTELRDYERAHAARADFLRMYENRLAKLRSER
jgi:hypothetical protein